MHRDIELVIAQKLKEHKVAALASKVHIDQPLKAGQPMVPVNNNVPDIDLLQGNGFTLRTTALFPAARSEAFVSE